MRVCACAGVRVSGCAGVRVCASARVRVCGCACAGVRVSECARVCAFTRTCLLVSVSIRSRSGELGWISVCHICECIHHVSVGPAWVGRRASMCVLVQVTECVSASSRAQSCAPSCVYNCIMYVHAYTIMCTSVRACVHVRVNVCVYFYEREFVCATMLCTFLSAMSLSRNYTCVT